jgi:hypothetical protein
MLEFRQAVAEMTKPINRIERRQGILMERQRIVMENAGGDPDALPYDEETDNGGDFH